MSKSKKNFKSVKIKVSPETLEQLKIIAYFSGLSLSEYCEVLLKQYLNKEETGVNDD